MSDPKMEARAQELLEPHARRVSKRTDYGYQESSVVDYWKAVHVVADLLARVDEMARKQAEGDARLIGTILTTENRDEWSKGVEWARFHATAAIRAQFGASHE